MAYYSGEHKVYSSMGCFSTVPQVIGNPFDLVDYNNSSGTGFLPGQCQAFLTTNKEFILFVEQYNLSPAPPDSPVGTAPLTFSNKKVYPVKVTGLNLPLVKNSTNNISSVTVFWRDELVRHGSVSPSIDKANSFPAGAYRPGFGETIVKDLDRPLESATVQTNNLGLPNVPSLPNFQQQNGYCGILGRLMSVASYIDPELAKKYDASKGKKKKKSLNSQTYQESPQYPAYTPYQNNSGY
jgi:hypothetical protein